jgi:hypothetical protein
MSAQGDRDLISCLVVFGGDPEGPTPESTAPRTAQVLLALRFWNPDLPRTRQSGMMNDCPAPLRCAR